eukprot:TRINITY_DN7803_c0_g1_i2.p1 TRINITY_DN7803_c0_g1~~TRINITY_DN7803_c0_g1_i2.p1  ORF type:complete len:176 (-),score=24.65 TRINITY_DN7803_c0_g1_i2:401-928(-)
MQADRDISQDEVWWTVSTSNSLKITRGRWKAFVTSSFVNSQMSAFLKSGMCQFTWYSAKEDALYLTLDNTRLIKQSSDPNSKLTPNGRVALKPIKKGDEITEDITQYDACPWPESWESSKPHASKEQADAYLENHPNDPLELFEGWKGLKHYIADCGEKGMGLFISVPLKKGYVS